MTITAWAANTYYPRGASYQGTDGYYYWSHLNGTFTGTLHSNTTVDTISAISISGGTNNIYVGMAVSGAGIPAGTYITAVTGSNYAPTSITLSAAATATGSITITLNGYYSGATYNVSAIDSNCSSLGYYADVSDTFGEWRLKNNQLSKNITFDKPVNVVPGATITVNAQVSKVQRLTLTASVTTFNINNLKEGETLNLYITQGVGAYTVAGWTSNTQTIKWPAGVAPTITIASGKIDVITFKNDGLNIYGSFVQNY